MIITTNASRVHVCIYITGEPTEEISAGRETGEPQSWRMGRKRRREKESLSFVYGIQRPTGLLAVVAVVVAVVIIPYGVSRISAFCWIIMKCIPD